MNLLKGETHFRMASWPRVCQALISVLLMLEPGHISFVAATARAFRQAGWSRGNWWFFVSKGAEKGGFAVLMYPPSKIKMVQ